MFYQKFSRLPNETDDLIKKKDFPLNVPVFHKKLIVSLWSLFDHQSFCEDMIIWIKTKFKKKFVCHVKILLKFFGFFRVSGYNICK